MISLVDQSKEKSLHVSYWGCSCGLQMSVCMVGEKGLTHDSLVGVGEADLSDILRCPLIFVRSFFLFFRTYHIYCSVLSCVASLTLVMFHHILSLGATGATKPQSQETNLII